MVSMHGSNEFQKTCRLRYVHIQCQNSSTCYPLVVFVDSYHQKVAYDPPILELKATYGLAAPEAFTPPALNSLWSKEVYGKMNSKMAPKPQEVSRLKKNTHSFTYMSKKKKLIKYLLVSYNVLIHAPVHIEIR